MNTCLANSKYLSQIKALWRYCFNDSENFIDYYFKNRFNSENTVVITDDTAQQVIAALQLNQHQLIMHQKNWPTSYIVGISTLPYQRGNGFMNDLISFTLKNIYQRQQPFAIMMAIDSRLYTKYGFAYIADKYICTLKTIDCQRPKNNLTMRPAHKNDVALMANLYTIRHIHHGIKLNRNEDYYLNLIDEVNSENGFISLVFDEGQITGYLIYSLDSDEMNIREWEYLNIDTLNRMLNFVYQHSTQTHKVTITTAIDDPIKHILPMNKLADKPEIRTVPFIMGRIIDIVSLLSKHPLPFAININIAVKDNSLSHNNGVFNITSQQGILNVQPTSSAPHFECTIGTFTQLYCGYISIEQAIMLDFLKVNNSSKISELKKIFTPQVNYINEYI